MKNNNEVWLFIVCTALVAFAFKAIPHTPMYKDWQLKSSYLESISVQSYFEGENIILIVDKPKRSRFKDLAVECDFIAKSSTILASNNYVVYDAFDIGSERKEVLLEGQGIPGQTNKIECKTTDLKLLDLPEVFSSEQLGQS